jgi:hypothetical protein
MVSRFLTRSTCKQVVELHPGISIDQQAVQQYAAQLDAAAVRAAGAKGNAFPINFESLEAEVRGLTCYCTMSQVVGLQRIPNTMCTSRGPHAATAFMCMLL